MWEYPESYNAWPFETMIAKPGWSFFGLYHAPYATEEEARSGHTRMVKTVIRGLEFGGGVNEKGEPSITSEEWFSRHGVQA